MISIVTPTYNRADVIAEAIDSVIDQTIEEYEHIIVDDGSTDNTKQVIHSYGDERITYIQLSGNQGANAARNRGIREASGQYVTFLDSDDQYYPRRLKAMSKVLDDLDESICGVTHSFVSVVSGEVVRTSTMPNRRITTADLRLGNAIGGFSNIMFRSSIFDTVGDLDEEMPAYQDYEFCLRALQTSDMYGIDEVLCEKRKQSSCGSSQRISDDVLKKERGQNLLIKKHGEKLSKKVHGSFYYTRGRLYMADGEVRKARQSFRKALITYPYNPAHYFNYITSIGGKKFFETAQNTKRRVVSRL